jgi:hypothetical protein
MQAGQWFHSLLFSLWIHCINYCKTAQKSILITKRMKILSLLGTCDPTGPTFTRNRHFPLLLIQYHILYWYMTSRHQQMRGCYLK